MITKDEQRRAERHKQRILSAEREAKEIEAAKAEMAEEHGIVRNEKFDRAWEIAWSRGHSSGINEVKMCFNELVDLLLP